MFIACTVQVFIDWISVLLLVLIYSELIVILMKTFWGFVLFFPLVLFAILKYCIFCMYTIASVFATINFMRLRYIYQIYSNIDKIHKKLLLFFPVTVHIESLPFCGLPIQYK